MVANAGLNDEERSGSANVVEQDLGDGCVRVGGPGSDRGGEGEDAAVEHVLPALLDDEGVDHAGELSVLGLPSCSPTRDRPTGLLRTFEAGGPS